MRPNSQRAKYAKIFIWIVTGCSMISFVSTFFQYLLLNNIKNGAFVSAAEANANDTRQLLIAIMHSIVFIVSAVMFIQWFRRAYFNQEVKFGNMNSSNGWASGAWFVPILNYFKPVQLMREIYFNAETAVNPAPGKPDRLTLIGWWWGIWILVNVSSSAITRIERITTTIDGLTNITVISMVIDVLYIPLAILAVKVVSNYNEMELVLIDSGDADLTPKNQDLLDSF